MSLLLLNYEFALLMIDFRLIATTLVCLFRYTRAITDYLWLILALMTSFLTLSDAII